MSAEPTLVSRGKPLPAEWQLFRNLGLSRRQLRQEYVPNITSPPEFSTGQRLSQYNNFSSKTRPNPLSHPTGSFTGYAKGSRPPPALQMVKKFFIPDGFYSETALPLNNETFQEFLRFAYKQFLKGTLPGAVEFEVPSMADVRTILSTDDDVQFESLKFPSTSRPVLKRTRATAFGLPNSKFSPSNKSDSFYSENEYVDPYNVQNFGKTPAQTPAQTPGQTGLTI